MLVGGCSGSTTGGPKVFRYQLLLASIAAEVRRLHTQNVVITPRYQGRRVSDEVLDSVSAFMMLYFLAFGVGSVLLVLLGVVPIAAISATATTVSTAALRLCCGLLLFDDVDDFIGDAEVFDLWRRMDCQ